MTEEELKQTCEVECLDNGYLLQTTAAKVQLSIAKNQAKPLITSMMFLANTCVL